MSQPDEKPGSNWGFSEIIVLVFLIGFFALMAIPPQNGARINIPANACINNMRQIDYAKQEWASEHNAKLGDVVTVDDIKPYIKLDASNNIPKCPSDGIYKIGKVGEPVTCSLGTTVTPAHVLP
jgi:hypothetical protein